MTREEKLNKATFDYVNQGGTTAEWSDGWEDYSDAEYIEQAFKAGTEWEHKRLVEKACEWLKENVSKYSYVIKVEGTEYRKVHFTDSLIEDFRKAMEE